MGVDMPFHAFSCLSLHQASGNLFCGHKCYILCGVMYEKCFMCNLIFSGDREKVKPLLSRMTINSTDTHGRTPLMYSAIGKRLKVCIVIEKFIAIQVHEHGIYIQL